MEKSFYNQKITSAVGQGREPFVIGSRHQADDNNYACRVGRFMTEDVDLSDEKFKNQEPKFFGAMLADILRIKEILDPVFPADLDIWQIYFRHYEYPGKEIRWWLSFAEEYLAKSEGKSPEECRLEFMSMLENNRTP